MSISTATRPSPRGDDAPSLTRREEVLVRQWSLVRYVLARRRCRVARIPRSGSRSTLYRDLRVLEHAGILLRDGAGGVSVGVEL